MAVLAAPLSARPPRDADDASPFALAAGAALVAHLLVAVLLALAGDPTPAPALDEAVAVEIATQAEIDALTRPAPEPTARPWRDDRLAATPPPRPDAPSAPEPSDTPPAPRVRETVHATQMMAAEVMAQPRSRGTAAFLRSLHPEERLIQLCNIEAMAQIARHYAHFQPDRVVAYAGAEPVARTDSLTASRAAFHSKGDWIDFSYVCRASGDRRAVVAFEFSVGDSIPRREWTAMRLPAER